MSQQLQKDTLSKKQIQQWLDKLRSGERKQCRAAWLNGDTFCCLSVLAVDILQYGNDAYSLIDPAGFLTSVEARICDIVDNTFPLSKQEYFSDKLQYFNDTNQSFKQIAYKIERKAKSLGLL